MCGRYSLSTSKAKIHEEFGLIPSDQITFSFNVAPTQLGWVITGEHSNELVPMRWGLLPSWSKDGKSLGKLINARSETITSMPSFRMAIRKRRCLVIADSFYEWRKIGGKKIPYRIHPKNNRLFAFAGIWETWSDSNHTINTFSIITTGANKDLEGLHDRMPLYFVQKADREKWLDRELSLDEVKVMMNIPKADYLEKYRVSSLLNSPGNDSPDLHDEIPGPPELFPL